MTMLLQIVRDAWGWRVLEPIELLATNTFGNVIVRSADGAVWRICPEELDAARIAESQDEYERLRNSPEFLADWDMEALTLEAKSLLGEPGEGRCYCLKLPGVLGGKYAGENLATISINELLAASGNLAFQIKDMPEGGQVQLIVKDSN